MEVLTNERLVKQRAQIGKYASLLGLAALAGGLIASFNQQYLYLSFAALILGFALSQVGSYHMVRWSRRPRSDEILTAALKGIDRKFRFYHYYLPSHHVLVGPTGLYLFLVKSQSGQISCEGARWRRKFSAGRALLLFGQEGLGNPTGELAAELRKLETFIQGKLPDLASNELQMEGVIVFSDPRVQLTLNEPAAPVLQPKQLKAYVRRPRKEGQYMSAENRRKLVEIFDSVVQGPSE
jgi:hypothetical protein